jgi:hypothetical protein
VSASLSLSPHCVCLIEPLTVYPTVSLTVSASLSLSPHCVTLTEPLTVLSPSPALPLCLSPSRCLSLCVSLAQPTQAPAAPNAAVSGTTTLRIPPMAVAMDAERTVIAGSVDSDGSDNATPPTPRSIVSGVAEENATEVRTAMRIVTLARDGREWSLNEGKTSHARVVRVGLGTGYENAEGNRRASLSPEIPNRAIRNLFVQAPGEPAVAAERMATVAIKAADVLLQVRSATSTSVYKSMQTLTSHSIDGGISRSLCGTKQTLPQADDKGVSV